MHQEPPHLVHGLSREVRSGLVAPGGELRARPRPVAQQGVDPQHRRKARVAAGLRLPLPDLAFLVVEDRVGHGDEVHVGDLHHLVDVLIGGLLGEPFAVLRERLLVRVQTQSLQRREDAPAGLAERRPLYEQMLPDMVGLLGLAHGPILFVGEFRRGHGPKHLGDQVVVRDQLIHAPEEQPLGFRRGAEDGRAGVGVRVAHRLGPDGLLDPLLDLCAAHGSLLLSSRPGVRGQGH